MSIIIIDLEIWVPCRVPITRRPRAERPNRRLGRHPAHRPHAQQWHGVNNKKEDAAAVLDCHRRAAASAGRHRHRYYTTVRCRCHHAAGHRSDGSLRRRRGRARIASRRGRHAVPLPVVLRKYDLVCLLVPRQVQPQRALRAGPARSPTGAAPAPAGAVEPVPVHVRTTTASRSASITPTSRPVRGSAAGLRRKSGRNGGSSSPIPRSGATHTPSAASTQSLTCCSA